MKKFLSTILAITVVVLTLPFSTMTTSAATEGCYTYTVSNGEATITDCDPSIGSYVVIPSFLGGYPVTKLGDYVFEDCKITDLIMPDTIVEVGEAFLFWDSNIRSVKLSYNLKSMGSGCLFWCENLSTVILPGVDPVKGGPELILRSDHPMSSYYDYKLTHVTVYENSFYHYGCIADGIPYKLITRNGANTPSTPVSENQIKSMVENIDLGPYAVKGATIDLFGNEISLIDIEAKIKLNIGNLKIIHDGEDDTVQVLLGFDKSASANISGDKNSTTYWSESYKEVKSMYQLLTGKKVDNTRLWNKYSSLRSKLKKINGNLVVDVSYDYAGYLEFKKVDGKLKFAEGGLMASFNANTSLRSYYGPCYVALGIDVGAEGTLAFVNENNKANLQLSLNPSLNVSANAGLGGRSTYAEAGAYGTLDAIIETASNKPFTAYADLGIRWEGYLLGKEVFSGSKSLAKVELYPNFGESLKSRRIMLMPEIDASNSANYESLINSSKTISRSYLNDRDTETFSKLKVRTMSLSNETILKKFEKANAFPLNAPQLVNFDNDTCLLVWIDDIGTKSDANMCSLMYSFYNGTNWSPPATIYEDGKNNDMPSVYSDGTKAYIVWQKASIEFDGSEEISQTLKKYDLHATVFDSLSQTFSKEIVINDTTNNVFEMTPEIYGNNGEFSVAWIENSDNNIYGQSGASKIYVAKYDANGIKTELSEVITTDCVINGLKINEKVYYSILKGQNNSLYQYDGSTSLIDNNVEAFSITNNKVYYLKNGVLKCYNGENVESYDDFGELDNINIISNGTNTFLFTTALNKDFTKTLHYSQLQEDNTWTAIEAYTDNQYFIRNYSPIIDSTGEVYVAFNNIDINAETEYEKSILTVNGKSDSVDIQLDYIDFDNEQLSKENIELKYKVKNNSSVIINGLGYEVYDNENNLITSGVEETVIDSFNELELSLQCKSTDVKNKQLKLVVTPIDYYDYNLDNNNVLTTIECAHKFTEFYVLPTGNTNGKMIYDCDYCGSHIEDEIENQPAIKFSGASLTLYDDISVNYLVKKEFIDSTAYAKCHVIFDFNGAQYKVNDYTVSGDYYVFSFDNISPDKMNDVIKATLYVEVEGIVVSSATKEYSISTYCYSMLSKYNTEQYAELRTLLVDLLNYGSDTQNYTGYNTDNLVNANLTDEQKTWASANIASYNNMLNTKYGTIESPAVSWRGAELLLDTAITMKFIIKAEDISNLSVKITNDAGKVWTVKSDTFKKYDEGQYYVYFSGLDASQMSDCIYLTVYNGEQVVSNTVRYSIESYASSKQNSTDEKLVKLISSMMKYGKSAYNYKN